MGQKGESGEPGLHGLSGDKGEIGDPGMPGPIVSVRYSVTLFTHEIDATYWC